MTASIDGVIGNDNTSDFDVETKINAVEFYGYNYTNIEVDGEFQNDYFEGNFAIDDPNVEMICRIVFLFMISNRKLKERI